MSSILKKKGKKKKKKKPENNEIIPQRHERIGNLNYYSEEIAKNIIEKIISLAVSSDFMENVNKNFDNFCIEMMSRKLENVVEMIHINREKDDFDIDNIDISSEIKYYRTDTNLKRYKNTVHKHIWDIRNDKAEDNLMKIANVPKEFKTYMNVYNKKIEDCLDKSTIIQKNKYLKKNKFYQYNIDIKDRNYWGCITQPAPPTTDRSTSNFNCYVPRKENKDKQDNGNNKNKRKNQSRSSTKKYYSKIFKSLPSKRLNSFNEKPKDRKDNNIEDENSSNKKKKFTMINLPFYPIENLEIRKESEEILNLRKEQLELIIQKEKELKQSKIKIRNDFEKNKKKKKGKYTIDNEGKIVMINEIKPENLLKEFYPVISKQKEVKLGKTLEAVRKEKIKMENNAKKNIEYNETDRQNKFHFLRARVNNSLNDINKNSDIKDKENSNSKDSNNILNQNKRQTIDKSDDTNDVNIYQFEPSGSNFDIMNPSIGVKIQEKHKVKNGGVNFYEKFQKYSINEFNKTLQDTLEWTKYKLKERQNDGYMVSTNIMPNFKKLISIKEEKNANGLNTLDTNNNNITKKKLLQKTYSNGFHKSMTKSKSDIFTSNDKFPVLKEILLHEDKDEKNMMMKLENNNNKYVENILGNRKQISIGLNNINRSMIEEGKLSKKIYSDVDDFNKKLIMGNAVNERTINRNIILPKISNRKNDINFNNTMIQFHRTRFKKGSMERISSNRNNIRDDKGKKKGMKRNNSVKVIQ